MGEQDEILARFANINMWRRGDERAPHKPLLILYALGRWQAGVTNVAYVNVDREVGMLLRDFGPPRKTSASYPFCRLENDGIWLVDAPDDVMRRSGNKQPPISELRRLNVEAGFTPDVRAALDADPTLASRIAQEILDAHFPESIHSDILAAVGLDPGTTVSRRRKRDASFRPRVLVAYEYRCCVCGFDARIGTVPIALDAAHIRWHQAGGADEERNGLALCSLHHKTFDLGAFTIDEGLTVLVSDEVVGSARTEATLHAFHGLSIRPPQRPDHSPDPSVLGWHRREVFRGRPRHVG